MIPMVEEKVGDGSVETKDKNRFIRLLMVVVLSIVVLSGIVYFRTSPILTFEKNLRDVLKLAFTGPDDILNQCYSEQDTSEDKPDYRERLTELYSPYFSEKGLKLFIAYYSSIANIDRLCVDTPWKIEAGDEITITPYHTSENYFNYSIVVYYWKNEKEKKEITITGKAMMGANGKVDFWNLSPQSDRKIIELDTMFKKDK